MTGNPPESPMLEAYGLLGVLAGQTERVRLGTLVTSVAYRHPGVLLKTVTTLDVLSGGRMNFGVGPGAPFNVAPQGSGTAFEAEGLGIPFAPLRDRFEMLEELLGIAHQMWNGDEAPFSGKHYQLQRPLNSPPAISRPRPPILVAGGGEKKTLRLVAQYADACHLPGYAVPVGGTGLGGDGDLRRKLDVLRGHCAAAGRDYAEIEKTIGWFFDLGEDPAAGRRDFLSGLARFAASGFHHVIVSPRGPWDRENLAALTGLLPDIHAIEVAEGR
jgi:alkanesulfonate monooxygenase SsuD/methylene tetrahydromethanopterin reductase-like flavin-dependent oxidoreductase (luciferase family)